MKICFRCDASLNAGSGHVRRCLSLAEKLKMRGHDVLFLTSPQSVEIVPVLRQYSTALPHEVPEKADWLIVDHYDLDEKYESACRAWADNILVIDDLANRMHDCDVLLDQTLGRDPDSYRPLTPRDCKVLAGSAYALLRSQFHGKREEAMRRREERAGAVERVLLFLSGTDPDGMTFKILDLLPVAFRIDVVGDDGGRALPPHVVCHGNVEDMAALMLQADIAVGAGGTASYERCCMGLPVCVLQIADNQADNIHALVQAGAARESSLETVADDVLALLHDPDAVKIMTEKAFSVCDGRGTERLADVIESAMRAV